MDNGRELVEMLCTCFESDDCHTAAGGDSAASDGESSGTDYDFSEKLARSAQWSLLSVAGCIRGCIIVGLVSHQGAWGTASAAPWQQGPHFVGDICALHECKW